MQTFKVEQLAFNDSPHQGTEPDSDSLFGEYLGENVPEYFKEIESDTLTIDISDLNCNYQDYQD